VESGDHAPVMVPGDATNSLLVQKITGRQKEGTIMPPAGKLSEVEIQTIINWTNAGPPEK
jgi:cytochrome c